ALALTDHGNLHGAIEFYKQARKIGIKPIIGYEAYIAPTSRKQKDAGSMKEASYHLTLLAQNRAGYQNLLRLSSTAFLDGFYFRPRIDKEVLAEMNEGIICLSGCASSELNRRLLRGTRGGSELDLDIEGGIEVASWYRNVFGDRYYIELQDNGLEIQRTANRGAIEVARRLDIPLVTTSDVHYVYQKEAEAQDVLLCINTGKFRTDSNRMRMDSNQFHLRSQEEMYAAFPNLPDAVARSQEIADRIEIDLNLGQRHFPVFTPPDGKTSEQYLRELCELGLKERYASASHRYSGGELSEEVQARLDRELEVINKLGFPNYFLIVWDFVRFARSAGIEATARGSGVGSLVCYALYMSHVCPLEYDLLFERFLDENRVEAPDIDIDFEKERRGEVLQYVKDKYGLENVAQIGTFGTLAARASVRDTGRALGLPIHRVDSVVAKVPEELKITLPKALEKSEDLKKFYNDDPEVRELLDLAQQIEGLARNVGTHACAVVIADRPLTDYVPLQTVSGKTEVVTQWCYQDVEAAGLLKMDFLGLRNLTMLSRSVQLIEQTTGEKVNPYEFPLDDKETYALLCRGETKGVFQLESGGIRDLLQRMKPDNFRDIIATAALYRPGPLEGGMVDDYIEVKHGRKKAVYLHPIMEKVLTETHGVMVYQEQVMRILNRLGGIELASAYTCIKAISKKNLALIEKFKGEFIEGVQENGLTKRDGENLFELIVKFAGYGFNKSHSTAYALIAYMTAYLKAHYPVEFMAALLSSDMPGRNFKRKDSMVEHIEDCQRMHIKVVPPTVNGSAADFTVQDGKIHFALTAIKGCGEAASEAIHREYVKNGPYRDLFDLCERVDPGTVNRSTIETLIKAGAMDEFGARRSQLYAVVDRAMQSGAKAATDRRHGQMSLFGDIEEEEEEAQVNLPEIPEWEERDLLMKEKEVLGFYQSSHPLAEHKSLLEQFCSHSTTEAAELAHRTEVILGGMLSALKIAHTKNPKPGRPSKYGMFDLEDHDGIMRCICWPEQFAEIGELVQPDAILIVRGAIDKRPGSEEANLIVNDLITLDDAPSRLTQGIAIRVIEKEHGQEGLEKLYEVLRGYPGNCPLQLHLCLEDGRSVACSCKKLRLDITPEMRHRVEDLLGPGHIRMMAAARGR
ncbi:MAG: DNA polymerase III subunit alpha, partial [Planctomycetia bacterium]